MKSKKYIGIGILSLFILFVFCSVAIAQAAVVSVSPSTQNVATGETFTVDITIDPSISIAGAQFDLSFNPALVNGDSVTEGNLLKQGGAGTYFSPGTINNIAGTITGVAGAITTPGQSVSSQGVFATIEMTAKSVDGTSTLNLSNVIVGDLSGNPVSIIVNNGSATVGVPTPINITADTTEVPELTVVQLTVTGVAGRAINVKADPLSENAYFPAGIDDNPMDKTTNNFNDTIDDDGRRTYAVEFNDTGTYTIKVTDLDADTYDSVDITVIEKEVIFDVPSTVVIGDRFDIKGTANTGQTVTIAVQDEVVQKLYQIVIDENGEFSEEIDTSSADAPAAFKSPGSVRLKAYIDYSTTDSLPKTIESGIKYDGSVAVLMTRSYLEAELSTANIAEGDDFTITGTATGSQFVDMLIVSPNGYNGSNIEGGEYMYYATTSVTAVDDTFYKKIRVGANVDTGRYLVMVLSPGSNGVWGEFGCPELYNPDDPSDPATSLGQYSLTTRTQEEMLEIVEHMVFLSDDLLWIAMVDVQMPYVSLNPVAGVGIGEPLDVSGTTNREAGFTIVVTVKGPVELTPATTKTENGTFNATIDTTDAKIGTYIVKADDGDGNTDETTVNIGAGKAIFDTGTGTYPSIAGTHNGTITPNVTIEVSKLYTYPCAGTGGHIEYVKIWNSTKGIVAGWEGWSNKWDVRGRRGGGGGGGGPYPDWSAYQGDWHNISLPEFTLVRGETYNYTIRTGSYPQIIHAANKTVAGGTITCDTFVDVNGNTYADWIPAIRLGV
jgi:hypothetical protein